MLYDPKWEVKTKADPFSLEGLIAWLETKNPDEQYDYWDRSGGCLLGQYVKSLGLKWEYHSDLSRGLHDKFANVVLYRIVAPWTFGGALKHARAVAGS